MAGSSRTTCAAVLLSLALSTPLGQVHPEDKKPDLDNPIVRAHHIRFGDRSERKRALRITAHERDKTMIAPMLHTMRRLSLDQRQAIVETLEKVTRKAYGDDWFKWAQYHQRETIPTFERFDTYLFNHLRTIDQDFRRFIYPGVAHTIPLQEILWGGVAAVDGIPPLDHPTMVNAAEIKNLGNDEPVFGIQIGDDVRAYPYRYMDWHEMLNDTIGGIPVSLAYCTLCGSGILFDTRHAEGNYTFGSSGLLYRSNKLMFDYTTSSLWNQFSGKPVTGPLTGQSIELKRLPLVTSTWRKWRETHPHTLVMNGETGHERNYTPGSAYGSYFKDPKLMFPALTDDNQLPQKAKVFGLRVSGANKAWPLRAFREGKVINDSLGVLNVVLIGDADSEEVRAYRRGNQVFSKVEDSLTTVTAEGKVWQVTENELIGPNDQRLSRLPGHTAFWFAWHNFVGGDSLAK